MFFNVKKLKIVHIIATKNVYIYKYVLIISSYIISKHQKYI